MLEIKQCFFEQNTAWVLHMIYITVILWVWNTTHPVEAVTCVSYLFRRQHRQRIHRNSYTRSDRAYRICMQICSVWSTKYGTTGPIIGSFSFTYAGTSRMQTWNVYVGCVRATCNAFSYTHAKRSDIYHLAPFSRILFHSCFSSPAWAQQCIDYSLFIAILFREYENFCEQLLYLQVLLLSSI